MTDHWRSDGDFPALTADAVHLWRIDLSRPRAMVARLRECLNSDEQARAGRFKTETLQNRFVVGRGAMRQILARYLGTPPGLVAFAYGPVGKPSLDTDASGQGLEFNLAHTEDLALLAVTAGRPIGVDVETVRTQASHDAIIRRYFSEREQAEFLELPHSERLAAFYRGWSRKEAYLKATGGGIASGLDTFDVTLEASRPRVLRVGDDPDEAGRWTLFDIDVGPGRTASAAVRGRVGETSFHEWTGTEKPGRPDP